MQDFIWERNPFENQLRADLSGLSIYQPANKRGQAKVPRLLGFCAGFLEITMGAIAGMFYMSYSSGAALLVIAMFTA